MKKIIFCADGTWSHPKSTTTVSDTDANVYKLYKSLLTTATQCRRYDDGVGADGILIGRLLGAPSEPACSIKSRKVIRRLPMTTSMATKFSSLALAVVLIRPEVPLPSMSVEGSFPPTLWVADNVPGQIIEQVWFTGCHSSVGGGCPDAGLSDITVKWMLQKGQQHGLEIDPGVLNTYTAIDSAANGLGPDSGIMECFVGNSCSQVSFR